MNGNIGGIAEKNEIDRTINGRCAMRIVERDGKKQIDFLGRWGNWEENISLAYARSLSFPPNKIFVQMLNRHFGVRQK